MKADFVDVSGELSRDWNFVLILLKGENCLVKCQPISVHKIGNFITERGSKQDVSVSLIVVAHILAINQNLQKSAWHQLTYMLITSN